MVLLVPTGHVPQHVTASASPCVLIWVYVRDVVCHGPSIHRAPHLVPYVVDPEGCSGQKAITLRRILPRIALRVVAFVGGLSGGGWFVFWCKLVAFVVDYYVVAYNSYLCAWVGAAIGAAVIE